jgi:hypothetical protein
MKKIFPGLPILCCLFLLYNCAETTDPVLPTATQTRRLLTGNLDKKWKVMGIKSLSGTNVDCNKNQELNFISLKDSVEFTNSEANCLEGKTLDYAKFLVKIKQQDLYLQYYKVKNVEDKDLVNDTIQRKILYITDKILRTQYYSSILNEDVIEEFTAL